MLQQMKVDCCVMSSEAGSRCQLTNEFSVTIGLCSEGLKQSSDLSSFAALGLPAVPLVKHRLTV